jgi:hypothetical protein
MAKGDAAKATQEAEKLSEEFRDTFSDDFYACLEGSDNDAFYKAIENILADAACLLPDGDKLTVFSSILDGAARKSMQYKRYKKMDRFFDIMRNERLN